jgi:hypothetical protein
LKLAAARQQVRLGLRHVMWCYWDWEERVEGSGGGATVPRATVPGGTVHARETRGLAGRAVRGAGNAGRGASPMAGKREGFSF